MPLVPRMEWLIAASLLAAGCTGRPAAEERARATVTIDSAATESVAASPEFTAPGPAPAGDAGGDPTLETSLAPVHDVEVRARLDGEVVAIAVDEGARVAAGTVLARFDDRERRATLQEREAQAARTLASWERAQRLHEQKLVSEEAWIGARSDWQIAIAQRDRAKVEWERCTVRSPISGVVTQRRAQPGLVVEERDMLFRVSDPSRLRAELLLPESRLGTVRAGQPVTLVPAAGGRAIAARITRVSPLVDPASGAFRVTIDVDNRAGRVPAGITAHVILAPEVAATR